MAHYFQTSLTGVYALLATSVQSAVNVHMRIHVQTEHTVTGQAWREKMNASHVILEDLVQGKA